MARSFRDTIPDEADGRLYVSLLNRDGTVALHDVAVEVSSPLVQQGDKFGAAAVNLLLELDDEGRPRLAIPPAAVGGVANYTHTKTGTVHELTGEGENIRFVATAGFAEGDSMTVNGEACTVRTISGDALWGGFFAKGAAVVCWREGNTLNFSGAGLSAADKAQLVPGNLLTGVTIRSGGVTVAGGIPRKAAAAYTPGTSDQVLAAGQYLEGAQTIEGDANLAAGNILSGVSIFGVTGVLQRGYEVVAVGYYGVCKRTDSSGNDVQSGQWYGWGDTRYGSMVTAGGIGGYNNASMTWTCAAAGTYRISGYRFSPTRSGVQAMSKGQTVSFTGIQATGIVGSGVSSGCFTIERLA